MKTEKKHNSFIGSIAGVIVSLFAKKPSKKNLKDIDYTSSTKKMGVTFTDKIRNTFRHKWIKKS